LNTLNNKTLNQILCAERGNKIHSFETQPDSADRPMTRPIQGWNRTGFKKNRGRKNPV
jgi:hypothetical protein